MGLDDFKTEEENKVGSITSRKKIKNVNLEEDHWRSLLYHDPHWGEYFAADLDESSIKAIVETMDDLVENGLEGVSVSEDQIERIKDVRQHIIEDHLDE